MIPPAIALVKREIGSVIRDRTIVIAILIQLFIASFSSVLLLGMLSLYDPDTILQFGGRGITIGVTDDNQLGRFMSERGLTVFSFDSLSEAEAAFFQGQVNAIVDTPQDGNGLTEIQLYLPDSDAASSLIRMVIQEPLKQYENFLRMEKGVDVRYTDLKGQPSTSFEFVYSVLLPMLMFFPAFVAGSMTIDSLTEEMENNTLQTLLSAPLTVNGMVGAKIASAVILAIVQCGAWLALLKLNGIAIQNVGWIFILALAVTGITSTLAAVGAVTLQDRERSQFIYSLMLLAGVAISILVNLSPITVLSRLAIGDYYTGGWNVAVFVVLLAGLYTLLSKLSHRLVV